MQSAVCGDGVLTKQNGDDEANCPTSYAVLLIVTGRTIWAWSASAGSLGPIRGWQSTCKLKRNQEPQTLWFAPSVVVPRWSRNPPPRSGF